MGKTEYVIDHIMKGIKTGAISTGSRLPSCRKLSVELGVNKITVNKAYAALEEAHIVYSIPCGGFYLVDALTEPSIHQTVIDFKTVRPEDSLIPYREFTHVINTAVDKHKNGLFEYEYSGCHPPLRDSLNNIFAKDGLYTPSERVLITSGAQQAIALSLQTLFKERTGKLLVEIPTYGLVLELASQLGIAMVGIPRNKDGYDLKHLEKLFSAGEITAFYVVPRHQNPTGYILDEKTKRKVAELSIRYGVRIIEDDYLSDLGSKKGSLPLHYYDTEKRTIHIRSFSKTFMPGIRIGAMVLPDDIDQKVMRLKKLMDLNTSQLPQAALHLYIESGMFDKHNKRIRRVHEKKLRVAKEIFEALAPPDLEWHVPEYGIFVWMVLPKGMYAKVLADRLEQSGILVKPASDCYLQSYEDQSDDDIPSRAVRLCLAGVPTEKLDALGRVLKEIRSQRELL